MIPERIIKAERQPKVAIISSLKGTSRKVPTPTPERAKPVASPLLFMNHFGMMDMTGE